MGAIPHHSILGFFEANVEQDFASANAARYASWPMLKATSAAHEKLTLGWMLKSILKRLTSPRHVSTLLSLRRASRVQRVNADAQLKLYSELLPGGFLHFGYFENPETLPESVSLGDLAQAQRNHSELVLEQIPASSLPVLDVGCGTGGLLQMLKARGFQVVGLTPDRFQYAELQAQVGTTTELIQSRFEDIPLDQHRGRYGTVVTSESLQYLDKKVALPIFESLLVPGGYWVICDYLRLSPGHPWSFSWPELHQAIGNSSFKVVLERDITPHVVPTLQYGHMLAARFARPTIDFLIEKVRGKEPRVGYVLNEVFERVQANLDRNVDLTDPKIFQSEKSYRLMVLQKEQLN